MAQKKELLTTHNRSKIYIFTIAFTIRTKVFHISKKIHNIFYEHMIDVVFLKLILRKKSTPSWPLSSKLHHQGHGTKQNTKKHILVFTLKWGYDAKVRKNSRAPASIANFEKYCPEIIYLRVKMFLSLVIIKKNNWNMKN